MLLSAYLHESLEELVAEVAGDIEYLHGLAGVGMVIDHDDFHYAVVGLSSPDVLVVAQLFLGGKLLVGVLMLAEQVANECLVSGSVLPCIWRCFWRR